MNIQQVPAIVWNIGFAVMIGGVCALAVSAFMDSFDPNSTAYNITQLGLLGVYNLFGQFGTIGTVAGVMLLLGVVGGGLWFASQHVGGGGKRSA